jgi:formylglycine-generating enzyme required for sulfatase activity
MRKYISILTLSAFLFFLSAIRSTLYANNISVSNAALGSQNTTTDTEVIQFDISWENSWRDSTNYDAAWVFIKYSTDSGTTWSHATLKTSGTNPADTNIGSGTGIQIIVPTDKKGAFIQRSATGSGTLSTTAIQLTWDYGTDGVSDTNANTNTTVIRVMAIEMVYIPTGSFEIGDGNGTTESANAFHVTDNTKAGTIGTTLLGSIKVDVNGYDDAQIEVTGIGIKGDAGLDTDNNGTIDNASFPTGYNAFYLMKYEVSQGQYRDFLNMLTRAQQNTRTGSQTASNYTMSNAATVTYRDFIRNPASIPSGAITFGCDYAANAATGNGTFDSSGDGEWNAMTYLSWMDQAAYADWAALRPFTELEYEKACRGPTAAVNQEYAWGSTTITQVTGITNGGASNETASNSGNGLCVYGSHASVQGPMRSGFAATVTTTRSQAGASYYGVMELSGNLWERPVTVGNATGRAFDGANGDGALATNGNANGTSLQYWPGYSAGEITDAAGSGWRGGAWYVDAAVARVSDRSSAAYTRTDRNGSNGARCARTP